MAEIIVHVHPKTRKVKHASAHDLRRSFGERWSHRVMPQNLTVLMRHELRERPLKREVGRNASPAADAVWDGRELSKRPKPL